MTAATRSRRSFLAAGAGIAGGAFMAANWPAIVAAAEHADHVASSASASAADTASFAVLTPAEAADLDAIAALIVPAGATPGAREAHVVHFIDRALGSFFAAQLPTLRAGLAAFQQAFAACDSTGRSFAQASEARQVAFLHDMDDTAFFAQVRRLTVLGLVASPRYGGNFDKAGWALLGFDDRHVWQAPFGHYDADYAGFEPYPGTHPWTADAERST